LIRRIYLLSSGEFGRLYFAACGLRRDINDWLQSIGSKITPEHINFREVYTYAERANAAYGGKSAIRSRYLQTVRFNAPGLLRRTFLQLLHHFIHVEAGRLLPLRIVPERHQELAHVVLRGDKKEGVIQ